VKEHAMAGIIPSVWEYRMSRLNYYKNLMILGSASFAVATVSQMQPNCWEVKNQRKNK